MKLNGLDTRQNYRLHSEMWYVIKRNKGKKPTNEKSSGSGPENN